MKLYERANLADVQIASEFIFLEQNAGLHEALKLADGDEDQILAAGEEALALMGLAGVLYPKEVLLKDHDTVAARDAAVAEQFFHADVAVDGFYGILLAGIEGRQSEQVPDTQMVNNAAMVENIERFVEGGPLQGRLDEVFVVRPYLNPRDRSAWMDYPRHVLTRLANSQFRELLTPEQAEQVDRDSEGIKRTRYIDDVFISKLINSSAIDGELMASCGVGSREIRLALVGGQTDEETVTLTSLHEELTRYLLGESVEYESQKVVEGSALFVPINQLHRATPYNPLHHRRSVAAIKCHVGPDQSVLGSWVQAQGTEY